MRTILSWLFCLLATTYGAPLHAAKTHIDRRAGIKFVVPFKNPRILHGPQIAATVAPTALDRNGAPVHYTTAIYTQQQLPQVTVAVHAAAGQITRELADTLASQDATVARAAVQEWLGPTANGLSGFTFDKETLRGFGDLPEERSGKSKLIVQLVRDRVTAVRYQYRNAKDLEGFQVLLASLKVGRLSKLTYQGLPHAGPNATLVWIATVLGAVSLCGLLGAATWLAYRRMARGPELPPVAQQPLVVGAPTGDGSVLQTSSLDYFPIMANASSSRPNGADS